MLQDLPLENPAGEDLWDAFAPVTTETWRQKIVDDLKGASDYERLVWHPVEGFDVQPFYRAEDLDRLEVDPLPDVFFGGEERTTWHLRQDVETGDFAEAGRLAQEALAGGATAVGFVCSGESGIGLPVHRRADMEALLGGLRIEATPVHFTGLLSARPLLAMLLNEADRRGVAADTLRGSLVDDPLARLAVSGRLDLAAALEDQARLLADVEHSGARLHTLCVDLRPYHRAGASAVQELALALATASERFADLTERGFSPGRAARRLRFVVPVGTSYFMEIAKLRALRRLYVPLVQAFEPGLGAPSPAYVAAVTSRWNLTLYDPHVNLLRATTEASSAVVGGCDELQVLPFDAVSGASDPVARRLARNIQLILLHEAHLNAVRDPAAGSYYVETLTDRLARHAWSLFQEIEGQGGLLSALRQGFIQQQIGAVRAQRAQDVAAGKRVFVGVNQYPDLEERRLPETPRPLADATAPVSSLSEPRYSRLPMEDLRGRLREGAPHHDVTEPAGRPDETLAVEPLPQQRGAEPFETLRLRTERAAQARGRRPAVFLLPVGDAVMAHARATFSRNFFGCAGFDVFEGPRFDTVEEGVRAARARQADLVVLCSSDPEYAAYGPALCAAYEGAGRRPLLVVAGDPTEQVAGLKAAGIDDFIHRKTNLLEALTRFQRRLLGDA